MSKIPLVFRWFGINALFLGLSFLFTGVLSALVPDVMLTLFGRWATLLSFFGAQGADEFSSSAEIFWHIIQRNTIALLVYLLIGLLLQGPLAMIFGGAFYALVAFLAPLTLGRVFVWNDWLLITVEMGMLALAASLGTAISGEFYEVSPSFRSWWAYSRQSWRSLTFETPKKWREVLASWTPTLILGLLVILALLLFVAWYETFGY